MARLPSAGANDLYTSYSDAATFPAAAVAPPLSTLTPFGFPSPAFSPLGSISMPEPEPMQLQQELAGWEQPPVSMEGPPSDSTVANEFEQHPYPLEDNWGGFEAGDDAMMELEL